MRAVVVTLSFASDLWGRREILEIRKKEAEGRNQEGLHVGQERTFGDQNRRSQKNKLGGIRSRTELLGQKQNNKDHDSQNVCEVTLETLNPLHSLLRTFSPLEPWVGSEARFLAPTVPNPLSNVLVSVLLPIRENQIFSHGHLWNSNQWSISKIF